MVSCPKCKRPMIVERNAEVIMEGVSNIWPLALLCLTCNLVWKAEEEKDD